MKKGMLLLFAVLLMSAAAFSQGFGLRAGVNLQTINGKDYTGDKLENDMIIGFSGGVNYEISIAEDFYLQPEYEGVDNDKTVFKNTGFGLSLGYRF